jgi:hypothetical protein
MTGSISPALALDRARIAVKKSRGTDNGVWGTMVRHQRRSNVRKINAGGGVLARSNVDLYN